MFISCGIGSQAEDDFKWMRSASLPDHALIKKLSKTEKKNISSQYESKNIHYKKQNLRIKGDNYYYYYYGWLVVGD